MSSGRATNSWRFKTEVNKAIQVPPGLSMWVRRNLLRPSPVVFDRAARRESSYGNNPKSITREKHRCHAKQGSRLDRIVMGGATFWPSSPSVSYCRSASPPIAGKRFIALADAADAKGSIA